MAHNAVAQWLLEAAQALVGNGNSKEEARWLLQYATGRDAAQLLATPDRPLTDEELRRLNESLRQRAEGTPLAYILGTQPFWSFELAVTPAVLIPRADTETLVQAALAHTSADAVLDVVDLGTGSGAVALALALERPYWRIVATDISVAALAVAQANAASLAAPGDRSRSDGSNPPALTASHGTPAGTARGAASVAFRASDWFSALAGLRFDLIVSNPPYVAAGDPHLADPGIRCEPQLALLGGADGLDALRRIVRDAPDHLRPGCWLWLEHGWDQGAAVRELLRAAGFTGIATCRDPGGRERASGGRR